MRWEGCWQKKSEAVANEVYVFAVLLCFLPLASGLSLLNPPLSCFLSCKNLSQLDLLGYAVSRETLWKSDWFGL